MPILCSDCRVDCNYFFAFFLFLFSAIFVNSIALTTNLVDNRRMKAVNLSKDTHLSEELFDSLELMPDLKKGVAEAGFNHCTPIQAQTLPISLSGKDVAGQAQTGTGKTVAFLLATMQSLLDKPAPQWRKKNQPRALIVAPTRELVMQIHQDAELLGKFTDLKFVLAYGGTDYEKQREQISSGVDVLVGTPGRLIDYFKQHVYNLKAIDVVVLDEADRMFDLGFIKDIRYLLRRTPKPENRQGLLFSATLSYKVMELAYDHMNNPEQVKIEEDQVTATKVVERLYFPATEEKLQLLIGLINQEQPTSSIVFVNTKRTADQVWAMMEGNKIKTAILSGDVSQKRRSKLLEQFKNGEIKTMVATDVAARGIHVPEISHVFNFDLPQDKEDYVHRIGRTARAGKSGDAISFACENYAFSLPEIEDYIGHKIPVADITNEILPELQPPIKLKPKRVFKKSPHSKNSNKKYSGKKYNNRGYKGGKK